MKYCNHWHQHSPLPSNSSPTLYELNLDRTLEGTCPDITKPQGYCPQGNGKACVYTI